MPRFLDGLFEKKDAADRRAAQAPSGFIQPGHPYMTNWDVERVVRDAYEKVIFVFKAIDANADKLSSWPLKTMQGFKPDWREVDDPISQLLNVRANRIDGAAKYFRYRLVSQLLMSKKGVFVEVIPTRTGAAIAALNLLPPARTFPVPGLDNLVTEFEVQLADGSRPRLKAYDPKTKSGVVWIRKPHPTDPFSSVTPLESAGISIDLDFYARLYNRNFMLNDGRSGQVIAVKGGLSAEDAAELKARFSPGMGGVGRTTVIEAEALTVQDTAVTPRDAQYAELRAITKEDILIALGTPESVLGNASGRTFDNADAERESWLIDTVTPLGEVVASGLEVLTIGGWEDDRFLWHDSRNEWVLGRTKRQALEDARKDVEGGRITLEEWRALAELDPIDAPGVKLLWTGWAAMLPTGDPAEIERVIELQGKLAPPQPELGPDGQPLPPGAQPAGALPAGGAGGNEAGDIDPGAMTPPSRALERARAQAEAGQS